MNEYLTSSLKYRPTKFNNIIGQEDISLTLQNFIKFNKLPHSILFYGSKGVGKTSCARILAKTVNCQNISKYIESCDTCLSCSNYIKNYSNVNEIDAASNSSVENVRNIICQLQYKPAIGKYNIYIIDEAHMLSQSAFNALLKTLEEPPKHVIFILITTEKYKIIPTVISRCQTFEFKYISNEKIIQYLKFIALKEKIAYNDDILLEIARRSNGSMRDALFTFDKIYSITNNTSINQFKIIKSNDFIDIIISLHDNDIGKSLQIFNNIIILGLSYQYFINDILTHMRNILILKYDSNKNNIINFKMLYDQYSKTTSIIDKYFLIKSIKIMHECDLNYNKSFDKHIHIEASLINICTINKNNI